MKISISKDTTFGTYYRDLYKDEIKAACKEFKSRYTDADLFNAFTDAMCGDDAVLWAKLSGMKVLSCKVEADFAGTDLIDYNNVQDTVTSFTVDITASSFSGFASVYFHCDLNLDIRTWSWNRFTGKDDRMYNVRLFEVTRDLWDEDWKKNRSSMQA